MIFDQSDKKEIDRIPDDDGMSGVFPPNKVDGTGVNRWKRRGIDTDTVAGTAGDALPVAAGVQRGPTPRCLKIYAGYVHAIHALQRPCFNSR